MRDYKANISASGLNIYDSISPDNLDLFIPNKELQSILDSTLKGIDLSGFALKTRSKIVKGEICRALGYPAPATFAKTQPRFPGQNFDVYSQQSSNVQIWNEVIVPFRRYVFVGIDSENVIASVKVLSGDQLAKLDSSGTTTSKYQARVRPIAEMADLIVEDTPNVIEWHGRCVDLSESRPTECPIKGSLLPIEDILARIKPIEGMSMPYLGVSQERNRGAALHQLVCERLGYPCYEDDGAFPDIFNQLLEIKLQTSPTIDLGLHSPDSFDTIFCDPETGKQFISKDVRYAVVLGAVMGKSIVINNVYVLSGVNFFAFFPKFQGKIKNSKLQITLPNSFFD